MRADRLVQIMILLQNNGKMTTKELSRILEVSSRTILRDMDALSIAGIPVVAERGKVGGWKLMDHFRSAISGLKLEELKPLFILPSEKLLEQLGINVNGQHIRQKLLAAMPQATRSGAQQYLEKIYIDTGTWRSGGGNIAALSTVQQALWEDRKLGIEYRKASGDISRRLISPLGLVAKGSSWYLVALGEDGEYRNFKVSRIVQCELQAEVFARPETFSLADYWKQSKAEFAESLPVVEAVVLAHADVLHRMTFTDKFINTMKAETADKKWNRVTVTFNSEQEVVEYVLGFGSKMKLLHPERLIERIVEQAHSIIRMYGYGMRTDA